ncbi:metalloregulator ArsR/SmtB family transcription factor [Desulfovibrio sp. OttesenSCG-928-F07]|nr:metalloregulator ArsR/SmtB family transcription factor [Desulfovibrio sp. OttesenSCG-928-F07]
MSDTLQYFKALSDETRLRLLLVLHRYELNVNELVELMDMGQSRVSRHLKILSSSGLLTHRRDGLWVFYSAAQEGPGRKFIDAIYPFLTSEGFAQQDLALAAGIVEERSAKTSQFFNTIAEDWDAMSREVLGAFNLPEMVEKMMPERCKVAVDLGCGTGNVLEHLLNHSEEVIGVDGSARMLELARRRFSQSGSRLSLRIGDLEHLPLRDSEADFICINLVLHHLADPGGVLLEVKRALKPNGVFLLTEFDKHTDESLRADYGDRWLGFEADTLESYMRSAGFEVTSSQSYPVEKGLSVHMFKATNNN